MADEYTIYLRNHSESTRSFWCFLAPPDQLTGDPKVFANSTTQLAIASNSRNINTFTIPVHYVVGAGASNRPVGRGTRIESNITEDARLDEAWEVEYATVPPKMGPSMKKLPEKPGEEKISIASNAFNQQKNEGDGWFSNMSFGIETDQGFMGMTWEPNPQVVKTLSPKLTFYVSTGNYASNKLATWTEISQNCAKLEVPRDFKHRKATVTLNATGGFDIEPGPPPRRLNAETPLDQLIKSQLYLAEAQDELVKLASGGGDSESVTVENVRWERRVDAEGIELPIEDYLDGVIDIDRPIGVGYLFMLVAGLEAEVRYREEGGLEWHVRFNGPAAAAAVVRVIQGVGAIFMRGQPNNPGNRNGAEVNLIEA